MNPSAALEIGHGVAQRIASLARRESAICTWQVGGFDPHAPRGGPRSRPEISGPFLYAGTAGIALFLTQAYALTDDPQLLDTASGALLHARSGLRDDTNYFSFHTGHVGILYALTRFSLLVGDGASAHLVRRSLERLAGREEMDTGIDMIAGSAGAIPALLYMAEVLPNDAARDIAIRLGERLIRLGRFGPRGLSWRTSPTAAQHLTGYAHGASGMAHALAELFVATGDGRFRYATEQAVAYECSWYDSMRENWPDFRHNMLSDYFGKQAAMLADDRARAIAELAPYELSYMSTWCHGASGIGLTRLRLFEIFGDRLYANDAAAAVRTVLKSLSSRHVKRSFALCHGVSSDCETLRAAAELFKDESARATSDYFAEAGAAAFERRGVRWPSGAADSVPDPTLMLGEAGIGYWYLRMADETVPSVTLVTQGRLHPAPEPTGDVAELRLAYVGAHFGRTLEALRRLAPHAAIAIKADRATGVSDAALVYRNISDAIRSIPDNRTRAALEDVFAIEQARFDSAYNASNECDAIVRNLKRTDETHGDAVTVRLNPDTRLVTQAREWDEWLGDATRVAWPAEARHTVAVHPGKHSTFVVRRLNSLAALVVTAMANLSEATAEEIVDQITDIFDSDDPTAMRSAILLQIDNLIEIGLVVREMRALRAPVEVSA